MDICNIYCKLAERLAVAISIHGFIENGIEYLEKAIKIARINRVIDRKEQEELYRQLYVYYEFAIEFMEKKKVNIQRYEEIKKY